MTDHDDALVARARVVPGDPERSGRENPAAEEVFARRAGEDAHAGQAAAFVGALPYRR